MRVLSEPEVYEKSIKALGLETETVSLDLLSIEAIACSLRRAAGFYCPCSAKTLIGAVFGPLHKFEEDANKLKILIAETLEALIAHGDLLELNNSREQTLIYAAPPSFVRRQSGSIMLLGIAPDDMSPIPNEIENRIRYVKHVRILDDDGKTELGDQLTHSDLIELRFSVWSKSPKKETAMDHLARMNHVLDGAEVAGDTPGLRLIDHSKSVLYSPGRWIEPTDQTGRFVSRRPQAYGADLWCYVELSNGHPTKSFDFPLRNHRGCDEAWRLQAAIDHNRGMPQVYKVRRPSEGACQMDFFSPVPKWAIRRWNAIGEPILASGCLFSYKFTEEEINEEIDFAKEHLWLEELSNPG